MTNADSTASNTSTKPGYDRRRAPLPQPDFTPYKKANAYPGAGYFFVGHSYNVDCDKDRAREAKRANVISNFFTGETKFAPVQDALGNDEFASVLSRCEHDLLVRLPENSLVGPAIEPHGPVIPHSFTV